ncbi:RNA repair transcriptional activator RtcR [Acuticoccus sp. M5D2P5]|nr:RNA repair transcriptional activator RtcR [Acuticoccus kalidii]MCF3934392.1 RNA repair transcriptional activator RtcR [Acuticoccus kalidii]
MQNVVIGFLGTTLDARRGGHWRPSVHLCGREDFPVHRLELLHDERFRRLGESVKREIGKRAPETEVLLRRLDLQNPWDFEEVYGALYDFARGYGFDEERERYHVHLTTGTHVAQICWFLLTEARHVPALLLQSGPSKGGGEAIVEIIDLDLSRYDRIQQRFDLVAESHNRLLKAGIETRNPAFNALIDRIERVAMASAAPILLLGETGTGKTELAERIYTLKRQERRLKGRFVHVNSATIRGERGMATLFGQRRAGTGASDRRGQMREADGGVLFLDEIDALGLDEQAMILDAIESGSFLPVGADTPVTSAFHLIAGANRDLGRLVAEGRFRSDLYARLNLWAFLLPRLADRREDIEPNLDHELARMARTTGTKIGFNADAREQYLRFALDPRAAWPGNFRDLRASVERLCVLAPRGRITLAMVEEEVALLAAQWTAQEHDPDANLIEAVLGERVAAIDPFDRFQLAAVIRACRTAPSLSAAGRALFAVSRTQKASRNDADRLRKYLNRFELSWEDISGA